MDRVMRIVITLTILFCISAIMLSINWISTSRDKVIFLSQQLSDKYPEMIYIEVEKNKDLGLFLKDLTVHLGVLRYLLKLSLFIIGTLIIIYATLCVLKRRRQLSRIKEKSSGDESA